MLFEVVLLIFFGTVGTGGLLCILNFLLEDRRQKIGEVERLFGRLKILDEGNKKRTPEEQKEVNKILFTLMEIQYRHPEVIYEYYKKREAED